MTNPVQASAAVPVPTATASFSDSNNHEAPSPAPASFARPAPAETPSTPETLELSVERGENGIFVYSLKDPSTGRIIAVIPTDHASSSKPAAAYQAGKYVSVSA